MMPSCLMAGIAGPGEAARSHRERPVGTRDVTRSRRSLTSSALDDVDGPPVAGGLLEIDLHVRAGLAHGLDDFVQADDVLARAPQRDAGGVDRLDRRF